jgi:hypothetical protein
MDGGKQLKATAVNTKNWQELIKPKKVEFKTRTAATKATLVAEPLERGFGLTLGNACAACFCLRCAAPP